MFRYGIQLVSDFCHHCSLFHLFPWFSLGFLLLVVSRMKGVIASKTNLNLPVCYGKASAYGYDDISLSLNSNFFCRPSSSASFAAVARTHPHTHRQTYDDFIAAVFPQSLFVPAEQSSIEYIEQHTALLNSTELTSLRRIEGPHTRQVPCCRLVNRMC